jgi:hypothetical protein
MNFYYEYFVFVNLECLSLPTVEENNLRLHVGYLILLTVALL